MSIKKKDTCASASLPKIGICAAASLASLSVVSGGQEVKFHEIEIQLFQEVKSFYHEVKIQFVHEIKFVQ